jgi:bifunctional UDP-N-acetylglucosamine pyrophosphorylase/glucosamine-1-phosphate N-acetyltransferase
LIDMKGSFVDVWYPWQILDANSVFLSKLKKSTIDGELEKWVYIKGNIVLGKWSVIKSGTRIEWNAIIGRNCIIGPNVCIRWDSVIGDNARIWNAVEIKNSSIWNATCVAHLSYIWDSVIGNNVNIWGGTITANVRHDKKNMRCMIGETLVDTGRKKLWLISWDHVRIGINNSIYPGRVIDTAGTTLPGEIVK